MERTNFCGIPLGLIGIGCLLAATMIGCGDGRPATTPVSGVVTFEGQPVRDATVVMMTVAGGRPATGVTDEEGRFVLTTFDKDDGAMLGEHVVTVVKKEMQIKGTTRVTNQQGDASGRDDVSSPVIGYKTKIKWHLPEKYADPATSGLTIKVEPNMEPVQIELSP